MILPNTYSLLVYFLDANLACFDPSLLTVSSVSFKPGGHRGCSGGDHPAGTAARDGRGRLGALALGDFHRLGRDITEPGAWQVLPVRAQVRFLVAYALLSTLI